MSSDISGKPWPHRFEYLLVVLLTGAIALAAYHPAFFGDELIYLSASAHSHNAFWATYGKLNAYKPRLLFNAVWAMYGTLGATRLLVMAVYALGLSACAALVLAMGRRLSGSWPVAWLCVCVLLTSRFGAMLNFDYVSGQIEVWSLASLLSGIALLFAFEAPRAERNTIRLLTGAGLIAAAVFIHERYVAAAFAVGVVLVACHWNDMRRGVAGARARVICGAGIAIVPLLLFVIATKLVANLPLATGTAGTKVVLGWQTVYSGLTYLGNVLLGTNFGKPWFVGDFNQDNPNAIWIFGIPAALFFVAWLWAVRTRKNGWFDAWSVVLVLSALGLVAMASLPGIDRQEARWMLPVQALVVLFIAHAFRSPPRLVLLALMLGANVFYLGFGSYRNVFNIQASLSAREIATALNSVASGGKGVFLQAPESDLTWVLDSTPASPEANVFCSVNVSSGACVQLTNATTSAHIAEFDFGLLSMPSRETGIPGYQVVSKNAMLVLSAPDQLPADAGRVLGSGADWGGWRWSQKAQLSGDGAVIGNGVDGNLPMSIKDLDGKLLVYRAHSQAASGTVSMRLQVNWTGANDELVAANIRVVEVSPRSGNFAAMLQAPPGARSAYVYASMHGEGTAVVESVRLLDP